MRGGVGLGSVKGGVPGSVRGLVFSYLSLGPRRHPATGRVVGLSRGRLGASGDVIGCTSIIVLFTLVV